MNLMQEKQEIYRILEKHEEYQRHSEMQSMHHDMCASEDKGSGEILTTELVAGFFAEHCEMEDQMHQLREDFKLDIEAATPTGEEILRIEQSLKKQQDNLSVLEILSQAQCTVLIGGSDDRAHKQHRETYRNLQTILGPLGLESSHYGRDAIDLQSTGVYIEEMHAFNGSIRPYCERSAIIGMHIFRGSQKPQIQTSILSGMHALHESSEAHVSDSIIYGLHALMGSKNAIIIDSAIKKNRAIAGLKDCIFVNCEIDALDNGFEDASGCILINCYLGSENQNPGSNWIYENVPQNIVRYIRAQSADQIDTITSKLKQYKKINE